ncbi:MAG TPA: hypothetical protein DCO74_00865 [Pseudomonas sp.]|nr:hypothetical protein [Pseudomonas sp.]
MQTVAFSQHLLLHRWPGHSLDDLQSDRRRFHALRAHIDDLLRDGASLTGRDPVRLPVDGHALTVCHGMLVYEQAHPGGASVAQSDGNGAQGGAIEHCFALHERVLEPTELTLHCWTVEDIDKTTASSTTQLRSRSEP